MARRLVSQPRCGCGLSGPSIFLIAHHKGPPALLSRLQLRMGMRELSRDFPPPRDPRAQLSSSTPIFPSPRQPLSSVLGAA